MAPSEFLIRYGPSADSVAGLSYSNEITCERSKNIGHYRLTLAYRYEMVQIVHP